MSDTPETDAAIKDQSKWMRPFVSTTLDGITYDSPVASLCRKLERERDEARADAARLADILSGLELRTTQELARLERERNAARELAEAFHRDQVTLLLERDRLDKALMKIEDLFVDGTDIYADRENMGLIARAALAQHK